MVRFSVGAVALGVVVGGALPLLADSVSAQPSIKEPVFHTKFGAAWMEVGDEFLPPASGPGPVTNDPRYPYIDNGRARRERKQPTYRVADLSNPILHKHVTLVNEGGPEVRRVYLNVPHSANPKSSWYGESVGHYENGDTLVVDTIGLTTKAFVDNCRTPHMEALHVEERFRLLEAGTKLEVMITVEDQGAFTTPWSAVQRFNLVQGRPLSETPCAENNFDHFNFGVAPRPQDDSPDF